MNNRLNGFFSKRDSYSATVTKGALIGAGVVALGNLLYTGWGIYGLIQQGCTPFNNSTSTDEQCKNNLTTSMITIAIDMGVPILSGITGALAKAISNRCEEKNSYSWISDSEAPTNTTTQLKST